MNLNEITINKSVKGPKNINVHFEQYQLLI